MVVSDAVIIWLCGWALIYFVFWHPNDQGEYMWYIAPWVNIFYTAIGYEILGNNMLIHVLLFMNFVLMIKHYTSTHSLTNDESYLR